MICELDLHKRMDVFPVKCDKQNESISQPYNLASGNEVQRRKYKDEKYIALDLHAEKIPQNNQANNFSNTPKPTTETKNNPIWLFQLSIKPEIILSSIVSQLRSAPGRRSLQSSKSHHIP